MKKITPATSTTSTTSSKKETKMKKITPVATSTTSTTSSKKETKMKKITPVATSTAPVAASTTSTTSSKKAAPVAASTTSTTSSKKESKMKKITPVAPAPSTSEIDVIRAQLAELQKALLAMAAPASTTSTTSAPKAAPVAASTTSAPAAPAPAPSTSEKAPRTYTTDLGLSDWGAKEIFCTPKSAAAKEYFEDRRRIINKILDHFAELENYSEFVADLRNVCDMPSLMQLVREWNVGKMAIRCILCLVAPVYCTVCDDTQELAEFYGFERANALMGSCHNTRMISKCSNFYAIPFERPCYNFSAIASGDTETLVGLVQYWFDHIDE